MTPLEQLDDILKFFATSIYAKGLPTDGQIDRDYNEREKQSGIPVKRKIDAGRIVEIIQKLQKDGYVGAVAQDAYDTDAMEPVPINHHYITLEGILFHESGGYIQQKKDANAERDRNKRMERNMFWATVSMAVGAVSLVIWEVIKFMLTGK